MLDKLKIVYDHIPKKVSKYINLLPDRFIFGKSYINYKSNISYNTGLLYHNIYNILCYARKNTIFGEHNIPQTFGIDEVFSILSSLPIISSDDLNQNIEYFRSKRSNNINSYKTSTGGTGRKATTVIIANESFGIEWAHMHKIWGEAGYNWRKHIKLTLRGKRLKTNNLVEFNPIYNELVVDIFKLRRSNFLQLIKELKKWKLDYFHGYPSLVKEFMEYCKLFEVTINIKGIFLGSEGISLEDRKLLQDFFKCKIISWYGHTEKIILAADFTGDSQYKAFTSYGYPSIYNPDENGYGEIIGTTFINKALPLINYRTGDFGRIIKTNENILLTDIKGRWGKDFVFLDMYKKIPTSSINIHGLIQKEILFYQIYQEEYGKLLIKILPKACTSLSKNELLSLFKEEMAKKLEDFSIEFVIVEKESDIIKSQRGKMLMLIQNVR